MQQPLSEKAKGKQRAIDPEPNDASNSSSTASASTQDMHRDVLIRFSEGAHDLLIPVTRTDTVRDIKRQVSASLY